MAYDKDNLSRLRNTLLDLGYEPPELERFTEDMKDDTNLEKVRKTLKRHKYTPPEFDEFKSDMFGMSQTPYSWEGQTMMPADMAEQRVMTDESSRHAARQSQPQPQQQPQAQKVQQAKPQQKRQQRGVPSWKVRAGMQLVANQSRTNAIGRMANPARQLTGNTLKMDQGKRAGVVSRGGRAEVQTARQQRVERGVERMQDPNMIIEQMLGSAGGFQGEDAIAEIKAELPEHYEWLSNRMGGIDADNMLKQNLAWRSIQGDMDAIYNEEKAAMTEREASAMGDMVYRGGEGGELAWVNARTAEAIKAGDLSGSLDRMVDRVITESPAARNWYEQRVNELMKQSRQAALKDMERYGAPGTKMIFDDMMSPVQARAIARNELRQMFRQREIMGNPLTPKSDAQYVLQSVFLGNMWSKMSRASLTMASGKSGAEADRMYEEGMQQYAQYQASSGARIAAPVATLVFDIVSGGFYPAGAAAKGVTWLGMKGLTAARMLKLGIGAEQAALSVGSNWGTRLLLSSLGGAANFGVYEMESTALTGAGQGTFDMGDVGHAGVSGAVKGLIFGVVGGAMGKVTEGLTGTDALLGELATISAEGTVFTAMDVWETGELTPESVGTSFGMALGGRAAHPAEYAAGLYARVKGLNQKNAPKEPPRINQDTYDKLVNKGYRGIAELLKDSSFAKDIVDALRGKRVNAGSLEGSGVAIEGKDYEKQRAKANMDALAKELEAMENDPEVDWQTLRKAKYVLNGEFVPEPTAMGWGVRTDDKGNMVGVTLDVQQRVINTFKLKNENDRKAWQEETSRQVDINAVRLGAETVRTQEMRDATVEAILETAMEMGINPKDAVDAWNKKAEERTAEEKSLVETAVKKAGELLEKKGSFADRATDIVEDKYGVKIDDLLKRPVNRRTQQEQQALEELLQRLNGTYNEAKDKSDAEIIQDEKAQAHDDGYNVEDARKNELQQKMQAARDKLLQMGYSDAWIEKFEQMRPEEVADFLKKTAPDESDAVMDYLSAKAAYDGMLDRVDEKIENAVKSNNDEVDKRVHNPEMGGDGMVRRVTLRDGRTVYVTGGKLAVKDGAVDSKNSDSFLTVYDEASGKPDSIDVGDIVGVEEPVSPDQLKQESGQAIAEDIARQEVHMINGDIDFKEGEEYQIGDVAIKVVGNDGDNVIFLQGDNPYPIARDRHELSEMVKASTQVRSEEPGVRSDGPVQSAGPQDMAERTAEEPADETGGTEEPRGVDMSNPQEAIAYYRASGMSEERLDKVVANNKAAAEERLAEAQKAWDETKETDDQVLDELERAVEDAKEEVAYWTEMERIKDATREPENAVVAENEMRPVEEPTAEIGGMADEKPAEAAAEGGISESERENWKDVDNDTVDMLSDLAKELGLTIRTDDLPEGDRGYYDRDTNEIVVNRNEKAADKVIFVLSHELTHGLEHRVEETSMFGVYDAYKKAALEMRRYLLESNGESYDEYVQKLIDRYANHNMWEAFQKAKDAGKSDSEAMKAARAAFYAVDEAYVEREITCDITGEMMKRPEMAKEVFNRIQDKRKLDSVKDWIVNFFRGLFNKKGTVTNASKRWTDLADKFEQMYKEVIAERKQEARKEKAEATAEEEGVHSETQAAAVDGRQFSITTEPTLEENLRKYAKTTDGKRLKWNAEKIDNVIQETADLIRAIHNALNGDPFYDEFAGKEPTVRVDWRDGEEHPVVTWSRNNMEYKYDMSADLLCVNNDGLEEVLSSPSMCDLMVKMFENEVARNGGKTYTIKKETDKETGEVKEKKEYIAGGFTSEDYINLYNMLRDMGFVVPCRGCFDAAARLKMLPSVSQKFENLVNDIIMERNEDPEAYDERLRQLGREAQERENARAKAKGEKPKRKVGTNGFPLSAATKEDAIRVAVAADDLRSLVTYSQLMSAQGQTEMLSDWGSLFRAWQRTGAGRPKDKLLPEPYTGDIVNSTYTIIGPADKKTPNFRDIEVNQGTSLRRNSHSELRPYLAIDEIQFMRDAFVRNLCVFKYMKELDDVRLFGQLGVKFNMSFFPAYDKNGTAAGLGADGGYIAAEESVGAREFPYTGEDGKQHYDGMRGWEEAQKYCNDDVSLSTVIFSVPHMLKVLTDVPTPEDPSGKWGSAIPFHSSGATAKQLFLQGLGWVRAEDSRHPFEEEAFSDWDKGVTNFEQVQNDRFGDGWVAVGGKNDGKDMSGHKLEFSTASHYYNAELDLHMFTGALVKGEAYKQLKFNKDGTPNKASLKGLEGATALNIDYNDKVRELNSEYGYKEAADYYIRFMQENGIVPRFHFTVPEDVFLKACEAGGVDPHHPKLGWKGEGNDWTPIDSPAYYSMFCDYGMTKADGKWSPQRPVGFINEQGEREFRMPDNTVEIVTDAMRRYTERRQKENAMVADAERRFADMMVEQGKVTREQADEALSKRSFSERDSRSKGRQYSLDEDVRSAEARTETEPSDAQKESGNYRKGHVKVDGFDVSIEQPKGSVRRGVDADGKEWSQEMHNTYGYIRGTEGVDGDHIDMFLSDHLDNWNGKVFVVDQVNKDGSFDEHKVMYGFDTEQEARDAYLSNYEEGWTGLGSITGVSREEFKKWVDSSHRKTKPFAEYSNIVKEEPEKMTDEEKSGIRYSLVEDPEEIRRLDNEKLAEGFRNVSLKEDGTLRSPMADRLGSRGTEKRPTSSFEFGRWERSDENPDLATDNGKIDLGKPNGLGTVGNVDYNPYIHIRPTTVNKQFKNAWERDDLVYIRTQYPVSEEGQPYHAEKAKLPVGRHQWNGGELILSRWDKPMEVVPWEEVADAWVDEFKERGVEFDIVPPKLLPILMERGVEILPPHKGMGKACNDAYRAKVLGEGPDGPGGGKRYSLVNAISRIRKGEIEQLAKEISEDRSGNAEDKLVVRLSKTTPEERKALVRAISEESNGTQSELADRAKTIQEMEAIRIEQKVISREDLKRMIAENDGRVIVDDDGMNVSFTTRSFEKLYNQVVLESGVANEIIKLLGSSKYAYSQPHNNTGELRKDKTKVHPARENALEYRNYVVKFENDEGRYYCRFIVMRTTDGDNMSHGAVISDISISKENAFDMNTEGENGNLLGSSSPHPKGRVAESVLIPDAKLYNFFEIAKTGQQKFPESIYEIPLKEGDTTGTVQGNGKQFSLSDEQIHSENFKRWFGDWENDPENASKVVDKDGKPLVVFHQTNAKRWINRETGEDWEKLDWKKKQEWEDKTDEEWQNAWEEKDFYEFDDRYARQSIEMPAIFFSPNNDPYHEYGQRTIAAYLDIKNPAINPDIPNRGVTDTAGRDAMEALKAQGYDGFIRTDEDGNVLEYGVFSSEQIKSAEAATYDDNGNLIPLSERFDTGKKDIRYSLSEDLENYTPRGSQLEQNQLNALFRLAQENKESVERRKNAMREANRQLTELNDMFEGISKDWDYHRGTAAARRGIASAQKEYDRWTVDKLVGLAKEMLKSGLYKDIEPYKVQRLVGLINKAAGKDDITRQANSVFDMLAKHQIKEWDKVLQKLLRIQSNKLSNQGVRVQGKLDVAGQTMIRTLKDAMSMDEQSLADAINDCRSRMGEDNKQIADNAANEYVGYMLAQQYHDGIKKTDGMMAALRAERREVEQEVYDIWREPMTDEDGEPVFNKITGERRTVEKRRLKPEFGGLDENGNRQPVSEENKARRRQVDATLDSIDRGMRKLMVEQVDNYRRMTDALGGDVAASITRAKEWIERDKERIGEIHHAANSDLLNVEEELAGKDRSKEKGVANWGVVRFVGTPLGTFEKYLRFFGQRSAYGEGRLFRKFMGGFTDCTHNEWDNYNRGLDEMNKECEKLFGCSWQRLMAKMRGGTFNEIREKLGGEEFPPVKVTYWVEGKQVDDVLNQDEVAYLIAVSKMLDGQMKLNRMGIDDAKIDQLRKQVDQRMLKLADWYQHEFLPKQRERYNEVYERMFGAPMAHIDNYIHININERGRGDKRELNERTMESDSPSSVTGSIKERKVNVLPIDLHTSLLDLALGEHKKMEKWAAWAEFSRDVSDLLKYKKFQNKVRNLKSVEFGSGEELWDEFEKTALIATGDYKGEGPRNKLEKGFANAAKLVSSGCINYRVHTALKQLLSFPAFMSDARPDDLIFAASNPKGTWKWAIENLPGFAKRWQSRRVGDTRLMDTDSDYSFWRNRWVKGVSKTGMLANASVDAVTVALGARGVYLTAKRRYLSYGYSEEQAERKALQDAFVSYNSSQQSSEGAFVASMQMDRTALNTAATTFRNASMGYQRRVTTGARNIIRMLKKGYKADMIENTKKQMMEEGLTEEQAQRAAERVYNRQLWHSMMDVANFGYNLPFLWTLGPLAWYLFFGDDNDVKLDNLAETARHGSFGFIEGLTFGGVASEVGNMLVNHLLDEDSEPKDFWDELEKKDLTPLPLISRMSGIIDSFRKGAWSGLNDLAGLIIQSNLGVDPNTVSELGVALLDACNGDFGFAKETAFYLMRILQFPQSQIDQLYIDELGLNGKDVSKHSYEDLAKRYAKYKTRRGVAMTSEMMSEESLQTIEDRYVKTFENKVKDRLANLDAEELSKNFSHGDAGLRKLVSKEVASREGVKDEKFSGKPGNDWSERQKRSYNTYQEIRDYSDLAEDIVLQHKQQTYKESGAEEKSKLIGKIITELDKIRDGRDRSTNLPQVKGLGEGEDKKVMETLRKARKQVIKDLSNGDPEKAFENLKRTTRGLGLRGEDKN